jgi:beta-lactamase regulating signal transducer with metallopeptidase domain
MAIALLLKATLAIATAATLQTTIGRRASAATRHLAWIGVIVALLLMPVVTLAVPHWIVDLPGPVRSHQLFDSVLSQGDDGRLPRTDLHLPAGTRPQPDLQSARASRQQDQPPGSFWSGILEPPPPATSALVIYLLGVVLLLLRGVIDLTQAHRLAGRAEELSGRDWAGLLEHCRARLRVGTRVRLLRSPETAVPMVVPARGAAILVPMAADDWSDDRRRAVLLHELAHVARRDCQTQGLATLACALYWPHPLVWWVARRVRAERELACDDRVLASGTSARDYAEHLLEIAYALRPQAQPRLAVAMASRGQLEHRILAVLDAARNRATPAARPSAIAAAAAAVMFVTLATVDARIVDPSSRPESAAGTSARAVPPASSSVEAPLVAPDAGQSGPPALPQRGSRALAATGTWSVRSTDRGRVQVVFSDDGRRSFGTSVTLPVGTGVPQLLSGTGGPVQFTIHRDAGSLMFEGVLRSGVGGGTVVFSPDDTFATRLVQRGLARPDAGQLQVLALADIGNAFFDELRDQGYAMPDLPLLMRSAEHGVNAGYVREMADAGYKLGTLDALITLRDHGVDGEYVRELGSYDLRGLPPYELQRARDHGVNGQDLRDLSRLGYRHLSLGDIIQLRDHGVTAAYITAMDDVGYRNLAMTQLVTLRNHGIDATYVRAMAGAGLRSLTVDQLITARNHGLEPGYVRDLHSVGYTSLSLDDLVQLRNHGVDVSYVRAFRDLGYRGLGVQDLTALRNAGVSPEEARDANKRAGTRLSVDQLRRLASSGHL